MNFYVNIAIATPKSIQIYQDLSDLIYTGFANVKIGTPQ